MPSKKDRTEYWRQYHAERREERNRRARARRRVWSQNHRAYAKAYRKRNWWALKVKDILGLKTIAEARLMIAENNRIESGV